MHFCDAALLAACVDMSSLVSTGDAVVGALVGLYVVLHVVLDQFLLHT